MQITVAPLAKPVQTIFLNILALELIMNVSLGGDFQRG